MTMFKMRLYTKKCQEKIEKKIVFVISEVKKEKKSMKRNGMIKNNRITNQVKGTLFLPLEASSVFQIISDLRS